MEEDEEELYSEMQLEDGGRRRPSGTSHNALKVSTELMTGGAPESGDAPFCPFTRIIPRVQLGDTSCSCLLCQEVWVLEFGGSIWDPLDTAIVVGIEL